MVPLIFTRFLDALAEKNRQKTTTFNFTPSDIGGTSENIKIDCINYLSTKFGSFFTIYMLLPLAATGYPLKDSWVNN